jgi:hypothetical protein
MQVRGASKGLMNEAAPIYWQYLTQRSLVKVGYSFNISELDCFTADAFGIIEEELQALEKRELDKSKRKTSKGGR